MSGLDVRAISEVPTRPIQGGAGHVLLHDFFGAVDPDPDHERSRSGPEAFLIESDAPGFHERPHFHDIDQFQVFFGVPGAYFGRTPMSRLMFQYADAFSTYGPFGCPDPGLCFFTLRATPSSLRAYMPDERDKLVRRGRRQRVVDLDARLDDESGPGPSLVRVLGTAASHGEPVADLGVVPAGGELEVPAPVDSQGQYCCVVDGALDVGGRRAGPRSLGWRQGAAAGDPPSVLRATPDGPARVLVLQFPPPS